MSLWLRVYGEIEYEILSLTEFRVGRYRFRRFAGRARYPPFNGTYFTYPGCLSAVRFFERATPTNYRRDNFKFFICQHYGRTFYNFTQYVLSVPNSSSIGFCSRCATIAFRTIPHYQRSLPFKRCHKVLRWLRYERKLDSETKFNHPRRTLAAQ
jgi:hypothetical protein